METKHMVWAHIFGAIVAMGSVHCSGAAAAEQERSTTQNISGSCIDDLFSRRFNDPGGNGHDRVVCTNSDAELHLCAVKDWSDDAGYKDCVDRSGDPDTCAAQATDRCSANAMEACRKRLAYEYAQTECLKQDSANQTCQTGNGPRTAAEMKTELTSNGYAGPWDLGSMAAAYANASGHPVTCGGQAFGSAPSEPVCQTGNGPRTESQLRSELAQAGYDGPSDLSSIADAYARATGHAVSCP